jgi:predicted XRE-type DNA-binding protein
VLATQVISLEKTWFRNQAEASRVLKVPASNISRILHGRANEANGYYFELVDGPNQSRKWCHGDIKATNIDTGEQYIFDSQTMAAKKLGVYQANISACLNGKLKKTGLWIFEYVKK